MLTSEIILYDTKEASFLCGHCSRAACIVPHENKKDTYEWYCNHCKTVIVMNIKA